MLLRVANNFFQTYLTKFLSIHEIISNVNERSALIVLQSCTHEGISLYLEFLLFHVDSVLWMQNTKRKIWGIRWTLQTEN